MKTHCAVCREISELVPATTGKAFRGGGVQAESASMNKKHVARFRREVRPSLDSMCKITGVWNVTGLVGNRPNCVRSKEHVTYFIFSIYHPAFCFSWIFVSYWEHLAYALYFSSIFCRKSFSKVSSSSQYFCPGSLPFVLHSLWISLW